MNTWFFATGARALNRLAESDEKPHDNCLRFAPAFLGVATPNCLQKGPVLYGGRPN